MSWLDIAKELPVGQRTRIKCPTNCGEGESLVVNHTHKSYFAHCFRCDHNPFYMKGKQTLEELARIEALNSVAKQYVPLELPKDFTEDIPLHGRLWLYKGGLTETVWKSYGIGYSPRLDRVILPVYENGKLVWFQGRALHEGQVPKYLQPSRPRDTVMFCSKGKWTKDVVVVEDILSAIRVGEVNKAVSLLGTKITDHQAMVLSEYNVFTWLDPDEAGVRGAYTIRKAMSMLCDVGIVKTDKDPKMYSRKQINDILEDVLCQT